MNPSRTRSAGLGLLIRCSLLAAAALCPAWTRAQSEIPQLTIKENGQAAKLELRELSVDVRLEGLLVETVLELEFFNHTKRRQEGEFSLKLPEGATVSTYALDILGKMRPGVSVEKEKARNAYESIKRKMIDPGLVERKAGNVYQTRIFPIEPNQPKRVRIGYIRNLAAGRKEPVAADAETLPFLFSFQHGTLLKSFRCQVTGAAAAPILNLPEMPGPDATEAGVWTWKAEDVILKGELKARTKIPTVKEPLLFHGPANLTSYFAVQGRLPAGEEAPVMDKPKNVRLIWDASFSGRNRDHEKEFAALDRYWKWLGDAGVSVAVLRNRPDPEPAKDFQIRDGEAKELGKFLREIEYDGAANFSLIKESDVTTLLVTDGQPTSPVWGMGTAFEKHKLFLITSGWQVIDPALVRAAAIHADLNREDWWDRLTGKIPLISVEGLEGSEWSSERSGDFFTVTGRLSGVYRGNSDVQVNHSKVVTIPKAPRTKSKEVWTFARRIWSQQQLRALEAEGDREAITAFAKSERLVSDYTSLIVLERFEDHLTYRIPPPEPDLLENYKEALEERYDGSLQTAVRAWKRKLQWHQTNFPWMDSQLQEEASAVAIWVKASRKVFTEDELNRVLIDAFDSWLPKARTTIEQKNSLEDQENFVTWKSDVGRRIEELKRVREKRLPPEKDRPIHVSVRGFVNGRGVVIHDAPLTLSEAIELSGGPFMVPLSRVYLYRDAQRTGYNMESSQFRDVPLMDGDMIVVEADIEEGRNSHWGGDAFAGAAAPDPFAAPAGGGGGGAASNPRNTQGPVFEETGTTGSSAIPVPPLDSSAYAPDSSIERKLSIQLVSKEPEALPTKVDEAILDTLGQHASASDHYRDLTKNNFRESPPSAATLVAIARLFFEKGDAELGTRILSNLIEIQTNKVEATRAFAYWLAEFGDGEAAIKVLKDLARTVPDEATRAIASFDLAQVYDRYSAAESGGEFELAVHHELDSGEPGSLATIALTDFFGRASQPRGGLGPDRLRPFLADAMPSDVRIVVTSAGDQLDLFVTEPESKESIGPVGVSLHGGRVDQSHRVQEYQVRFGMPGTYQLTCRRSGYRKPPPSGDFFRNTFDKEMDRVDLEPITLHVVFHTRWGTAGKESVIRTYLMEGLELELDTIEFGWSE